MSERLGHKLERTHSPAPAPGAKVPPAAREGCLVVDERCGFACEFQRGDGSVHVLPYHQLGSAEMTADGAGLTLIFATSEVRIAGAHLTRIKDAIGRGRNAVVRAADPRWKSEFKEGEVFVASLEIRERKSDGKATNEASGRDASR